jgi:hypothetical protein
MCCRRCTIAASYRKDVERHLRQVNYLLAILVVMDGQSFAQEDRPRD